MSEQGVRETAVVDGEALSLQEKLFVWGVLTSFTVLSAGLLIGFGYWLGRCN